MYRPSLALVVFVIAFTVFAIFSKFVLPIEEIILLDLSLQFPAAEPIFHLIHVVDLTLVRFVERYYVPIIGTSIIVLTVI